ncbi:hypothetical protein GXW78_06200 [Roseomonas terrae]|uniref:MtN3 and saliva related transmembrane protein n=1 Tax=Neoroseomonas terrae TaxID=424799 RepID=A0ABS5EDZ9_9PROT|nr:hypothetical protein [Neoroseomonas terrae]
MTFDAAAILGALATLASITSFAPQAWKIIRTRDTKSISAPGFTLTVTAFSLWLSYGVVLNEWPIILTNAICLVMAAFILMMKLLPQRNKDAVAGALDPNG